MNNPTYIPMKYKIRTDLSKGSLYRIERIETGELGGWIATKANLSQDGNAWVSGDALVHGSARVSGDAQISGNARVYGNARVSGDALVYGNAWVSGDALVSGNAQISDNARVSGNAWVSGDARVTGDARVSGDALVHGNAIIMTRDECITITNLDWNITVTPQNIAIGCQVRTHEEWLELTYKDARTLGMPKGEWSFYRTLIKLMIKKVNEAHE